MRYDDSALARLLRAAKDNDVDALEALMQQGEDLNQANSFGQTALHICAIWGNTQAARFLLNCGSNGMLRTTTVCRRFTTRRKKGTCILSRFWWTPARTLP